MMEMANSTHDTHYDDLEAGMDLPVTEGALHVLVTRLLQEDTTVTRRSGARVLMTVTHFHREEELEDEGASDE